METASEIVRIVSRLTGTSIMPLKRSQPSDYVTCKHCLKDFRAVTVSHLRNVHGYKGDHPIEGYKRKFGLQSAACREVRKKISEAKGAFWAKRGHHWTRARIRAEIHRLYRSGRSLRCGKIPVRFYEAGRRYFGTWQAAIEKAGLDYEEATEVRQWTSEKVVESIRELAKRGVPLSASYVEAHHPTLFNAAVRRFPYSWATALKAAGFDPSEHKIYRGRWDRPKAEDWARKQSAKGRAVLSREAPGGLRDFVYKRLGMGWTDFLDSLGVRYPGVRKRRWTKKKLLAEIRRWKAEGHGLNYRTVKSEYRALIHQASKLYSSWDRARAAAGV